MTQEEQNATEQNATSECFMDYAMKLKYGDRIRVEVNDEYIIYMVLEEGDLPYLSTEKIEVI